MTSMAGRTVLITGGTGGIGRATAEGLAAMGAHVLITGRDAARAEDAARMIRAATRAQVDVLVADLSSQSEVRRLAADALDRLPRIDVLVNNVGGYWNTRRLTADGLEHTFAVNHLAPLPAHQPASGSAEAGHLRPGRDGLVPCAHSGQDRLRRPAGRAVVLRLPCLQPVEARQCPVHPRSRQVAARQRRHRQRPASPRGERVVRSRGCGRGAATSIRHGYRMTQGDRGQSRRDTRSWLSPRSSPPWRPWCRGSQQSSARRPDRPPGAKLRPGLRPQMRRRSSRRARGTRGCG